MGYAPSATLMLGTIRTRHLVLHAPLIVRLFGLRAYARCVANCLLHRGQSTFLGSLGAKAVTPISPKN
jgi:hypothetical protein